jgi:hypothetical protein
MLNNPFIINYSDPHLRNYENIGTFYETNQNLLSSCPSNCLDLSKTYPVKALFEKVFAIPKEGPLHFEMSPDPLKLQLTIANIQNDKSFNMICSSRNVNPELTEKVFCRGARGSTIDDPLSYVLLEQKNEKNVFNTFREIYFELPIFDFSIKKDKELPMTAEPELFENVLEELNPTPLHWRFKIATATIVIALAALALKTVSLITKMFSERSFSELNKVKITHIKKST